MRGSRASGFRRLGAGWLGCAVALACLSTPARGEDLKNRWYFGGSLAFLSTTDDIRSNAAIQITNPGDDGIPFTGDLNEIQGCPIGFSQSVGFYCDPRPDDLLARENTIDETFRLDATAGFGLSSWFSLQLDASYFKATVGPVDAFLRQVVPNLQVMAAGGQQSFLISNYVDREESIPVDAGEITEIPVSLTGIVRFRKDSPVNPYVGAGFGMIFTEFDRSGELDDLNVRLSRLHIRTAGVQDEVGNTIPAMTNPDTGELIFDRFVTVDVKDAFEWHLVGGMEYFFNDRFSMLFDARYTFADTSVEIDLRGQDQVNLLINAEGLYYPDGSRQKFFISTGGDFNPRCGSLIRAGVDPSAIILGQYADGRGCPDMSDSNFENARLRCDRSAVGPRDIDGIDGRGAKFDNNPFDDDDFCFSGQPPLNPSRRGLITPQGLFVVQGGQIDLTGFSIALGVRFHF